MNSVKLYLSPGDISLLERNNVIAPRTEKTGFGDSYGGLNRALSWINSCDCAFISGWHPVNGATDIDTRKENAKNNYEIQKAFRKNGYGVIRAVGNYQGDIERSFCVFDYNKKGQPFFDFVRNMAETYKQDSFLFKYTSSNKAFLCYTYGPKKGLREDAGELSICSRRESDYTRIGSGKLTFE